MTATFSFFLQMVYYGEHYVHLYAFKIFFKLYTLNYYIRR